MPNTSRNEVATPREIPTPTNTGSLGTQVASLEAQVTPPTENPLAGLPIPARYEGLIAGHAENLGGYVFANILGGALSQYAAEIESQRHELATLRRRLEESQDNLSEEQRKSAVLEERADAAQREKRTDQVCITAGMALIGLGIDQVRNSGSETNSGTHGLLLTGASLIIIGVALLIFGWLPRRKGDKK